MRKISGCAVAVLGCFVLAAATASAPAQVVKRQSSGSAKPDQAGNAAPLFQLAAAELSDRVIDQLSKLEEEKRRAAVQGQVFFLGGPGAGQPAAEAAELEAWAEPVAGSVLARSLFVQACTRQRCEWPKMADAARIRLHDRLDSIALLVRHHARLELERNPGATCDDACALLRFLRFQSVAVSWADLPVVMQREREALQQLHAGLSGLLGVGDKDAAKRYLLPLREHEQHRFSRRVVGHAWVASVTELVDLHTPRLRDVLAREPGGFDAGKMCVRLQKTLRTMISSGSKERGTFRQWMARVRAQRAKLMPDPTKESTVRYRVDFGMFRLVLVSFEDVAGSTRASEAELDRCQAILAKLGG